MTKTDPRSGNPIAVSVITGFLGSGKTTLLNHLLAHEDMDRTAVLINEFGEVGLDHLMVRAIDSDVVLLKSGCICCTVQGELVDGLKDLYMRRLAGDLPPFDRIVIETTGLADPLPIVACIMRDPLFKHALRLDTLITTVDALHGSRQLDDHPEALRQAAVADSLLITKTDLADAEAVRALRARLQALNPGAHLITARFGQVSPRELFGQGFFDAEAKSSDVRRWLNEESYAHEHAGHEHDRHDHDHHAPVDVNRHDDRIKAFCVTLDAPLDWKVFSGWYEDLAAKHGDFILRVKGIVAIAGEDAPYAIHCIQSTQHEPTQLAAWPDADRRSRIVFITRDLPREAIESDLRKRLAEGDASTRPPGARRQDARPRWLNEAELSRVLVALGQVEDQAAADALRFMLLTGVSSDEASAARWQDIDTEARLWRLPQRAPAKGALRARPRRVVLGDAAMLLLAAVHREPGADEAVFFAGVAAGAARSRLDAAWEAATASAGVAGLALDGLHPMLASGIFKGLSPDLTRSLLGLRERPGQRP